MAAPTLQAQGTLNAVTTGTLGVTLPSHLTDDIFIVPVLVNVEATAGTAAAIPDLAGWTKDQGFKNDDGEAAIFWKRAASGSETSPTFTRGAGWDTGTDTYYGGRAYVIRGCITSGDPWDQFVWSVATVTANDPFPAVTVSGSERMVVQFFCSFDNSNGGAAPSGWTAGTAATTTTGTDGGFQTYRKDNVSSSTSADSSNAAAGTRGFLFAGISFKPPTVAAGIHRDVIGTLL